MCLIGLCSYHRSARPTTPGKVLRREKLIDRPIRFVQVVGFFSNAVAAAQTVTRSVSSLVITVVFFPCESRPNTTCMRGQRLCLPHNVRFHGLGVCKCKFRCLTCSSARHLSVLALCVFFPIQLLQSYRPKHSEIIKACFLEVSIYRTFYKFISQIIPKQKRKKSLNWIVRTQCIHKQVSEGKFIFILFLKIYQLSIN